MAEQVGGVSVELGANTQALLQAITAIDKLTASLDRMAGSASKMTSGIENSFKKTADSANKLAAEQDKVSKASKKVTKSFAETHIVASDLTKAVTLALGPLSGVGSRLIALNALFKNNVVGVSALVGGFTALAVATHRAITFGESFEQAMFKIQAVLKATGNPLGVTVDELNNLAITLGRDTLTSAPLARAAEAVLLSFNGLTREGLRPALYLAQDLSAVFGGSLIENTRKLGQIFENPITGLQGLSRAGLRFSNEEKQVIQALIDTGHASQATQIEIDKLTAKVGGAAKKEATGLAGAFDTLHENARNFFEVLGGNEHVVGSMADVINRLDQDIANVTSNTRFMSDASKVLGGVVNGLVKIVEFLAAHFNDLSNAILAVTAGKVAMTIGSFAISFVKNFTLVRKAISETTKAIVIAEAILTDGLSLFGLAAGAAAFFALKMSVFGDSTLNAALNVDNLSGKLQLLKKRTDEESQSTINLLGHLKKLGNVDLSKSTSADKAKALYDYLQHHRKGLNPKDVVLGPTASELNDTKLQIESVQNVVNKVKYTGAIEQQRQLRKQYEATLSSLKKFESPEFKKAFFEKEGYKNALAQDRYNLTLAKTKDALSAIKAQISQSPFKAIKDQIEVLNNQISDSNSKVKVFADNLGAGVTLANRSFEKRDAAKKYFDQIKLWGDDAKRALSGFLKIKPTTDPEVLARKWADVAVSAKAASESQAAAINVLKGLNTDKFNLDFFKGTTLDNQAKSLAQFSEKVHQSFAVMVPKDIETIRGKLQQLASDPNIGDAFKGIDLATASTDQLADAVVRAHKKTVELGKGLEANLNKNIENFSSNFTSALTDLVIGAKVSFRQIAIDFNKMIIQTIIQKQIVDRAVGVINPFISSVISGLAGGSAKASANGNVFDQGGFKAFANGGAFTNSIVSNPTLFPFANGTGLMGEAGPEAIMPLKRTSSGALGVIAQGGGGGVVNNVNVVVQMDGSGKSSVQSEGNAKQLGDMLGKAVEAKIAEQMRPGGLLQNVNRSQ